MASSASPSNIPLPAPPPRRSFLAKLATVLIGAVVVLFPFLAGAFVVSDPLRKAKDQAGKIKFLRVCELEAVPDDGIPRAFPIIADRQDAWTRFPAESIGTVYLIRDPGQSTVRVFNAICPHAGCLVGYLAAKKYFQCPCHTSAFGLDGEILAEVSSVSPRGMDSLDCEVRSIDGGAEVWVKFENFQTGLKEKIPTV